MVQPVDANFTRRSHGITSGCVARPVAPLTSFNAELDMLWEGIDILLHRSFVKMIFCIHNSVPAMLLFLLTMQHVRTWYYQ